MLLFSSLLLSLCLVFPASVLGKPTANVLGSVDSVWTPGQTSLPSGPLTVKPGETLELTCASTKSGGIGWEFPSQYAPLEELSTHGTVEITETEDLVESLYYSTIRVTNATYRDTGRYRCFCPGMPDYSHALRHTGNKLIRKISAYVYVADEENLFKTETEGYRQTVMTFMGRPYTFPCAVTDPDTELRLYKMRGYAREARLEMNNGGRITSDPQTGITLSSVNVRDTGAYFCRAIKGDLEEERKFYIYPVRGNPKLLDPILTMDHTQNGIVSIVEGDSFSLKCQAPVGKHQITTITWWKTDGESNIQQIEAIGDTQIEDPRLESLCSGDREMCSFVRRYARFGSLPSSQFDKVSSKLRILKAETLSSGTYYCKVHAAGRDIISNPLGLLITSSNHMESQQSPDQSADQSDVISYQLPTSEVNGPVVVQLPFGE